MIRIPVGLRLSERGQTRAPMVGESWVSTIRDTHWGCVSRIADRNLYARQETTLTRLEYRWNKRLTMRIFLSLIWFARVVQIQAVLTLDIRNFDEETIGKTVFIKYVMPWGGLRVDRTVSLLLNLVVFQILRTLVRSLQTAGTAMTYCAPDCLVTVSLFDNLLAKFPSFCSPILSTEQFPATHHRHQ